MDRPHFSVQPPTVVYQTLLKEGGKQNSSTPVEMVVQLDGHSQVQLVHALARQPALEEHVFATLRRFRP